MAQGKLFDGTTKDAFTDSTGLIKGNFDFFSQDDAANAYFNGSANTTMSGLLDPHISGYGLIYWINLPKWLADIFGSTPTKLAQVLQRNFQGLDGINDNTLETATTSSGFAAQEMEHATSAGKKATGFTVKMKDYSGTPFRKLIRNWMTGIRDPETNVELYPMWNGGLRGARYYAAQALYIQTRPDVTNTQAGASRIESAFYITNIFPKTDQRSQFNFDPSSKNITELSVPFTGSVYESPKILALANELMNKSLGYNFVFEGDWNVDKSGILLKS